jgi:hypothetical protein
MKKPTTTFHPLILTAIILISCNNETSQSKSNATGPQQKEAATLNKEDNAVAKAAFVIDNSMGSDVEPRSEISVNYNGKNTKIATTAGAAQMIDKKEYRDKEIPENAISACGGWWAGAGDYFYMIPSEKGVIIYQGWQDESQEDLGYHWEKVQEIKN